jgi:hypothetical protein
MNYLYEEKLCREKKGKKKLFIRCGKKKLKLVLILKLHYITIYIFT